MDARIVGQEPAHSLNGKSPRLGGWPSGIHNKIDNMDSCSGCHLRSIDSLVEGIKALLPEGDEIYRGAWRGPARIGELIDDPVANAQLKLAHSIHHALRLLDEIKYHSDSLENDLDCDFDELRELIGRDNGGRS